MKCKSQFHRELRCARERAELHVLHVTTQSHSVSVQPCQQAYAIRLAFEC